MVYINTWHCDQDRPAVFGPKNVSPVAVHSFPGSQDAGIYTRSELSLFWGQYLDQRCLSKCVKKVSAEAHCLFKQQQKPRQFSLLCSQNRFLRGQHDLTWIFQGSVSGYIWTSCICSRTLRHLIFSVLIF